MIKCHFVDVKSISSKLPRSSFDEAELEVLADAILSSNGLLRPLVLERTGAETYQVISGDREYYAAVRAKEKDIKQAEMVNAFVIDPNHIAAAIAQLDLLTPSQSTPDIDQLLASISQIIAQQLQPVLTQLDRHEWVLNKLDPTSRSIEPVPVSIPEPVNPTPVPLPATTEPKQPTKPKTTKTRTAKKTASNSNQTEAKVTTERSTTPKTSATKNPERIALESTPTEVKAADERSNEPTIAATKTPKTKTTEPKATKTKSNAAKQVKSIEVVIEPQPEAAKPTANPLAAVDPIKAIKTLEPIDRLDEDMLMRRMKPTANPLAAVDPIKAIKTLDLIDRLDEDMLMRRMKQSGIPKAEQLVPKIIAKRELQPNGKFDSWQQIAAAKISGLGEATIIKIIDKLK